MKKILMSVLFLAGLLLTASIADVQSVEATGSTCQNPSLAHFTDKYGKTADNQSQFQGLTGYYMNKVEITNNSSCTYNVGIASYKAYEHYQTSVDSRTYFAGKFATLKPGEKFIAEVAIPECTYQVDVFYGEKITQFDRSKGVTYGQQGRLIDAWYFPGDANQRADNWPTCTKPTPTPTPTATPTPAPTPTVCPSGTYSHLCLTPTPTPNVTATPKPTTTPTGQVQAATPTPTPPAELPSTGPGAAVVVSLLGMVGGLLGKKYTLK